MSARPATPAHLGITPTLLAALLAVTTVGCPDDASEASHADVGASDVASDGVTAGDGAVDPDATKPSSCGDGKLQDGEACDVAIPAGQPGACPTDCVDADPCTVDSLIGQGCAQRCEHTPIDTAGPVDGCCPPGASAKNDQDCVVICGNGVLEPPERCDVGIPAGLPGACPEACPDEGCSFYELRGEGCTAECVLTKFETEFVDADGCCPGGGNGLLDEDCEARCGNGVIEPGEACDVGLSGSCPDDCDDDDRCTVDSLEGEGCQARCVHADLPVSEPDDGCCADGDTPADDPDCERCGNGALDEGEACDIAIAAGSDGACPDATTCASDDPCVTTSLAGESCDRRCVATAISLPIPGDGCCPAEANANNDDDCGPTCGNGVVEAGEACDTAISAGEAGACPTSCDSAEVCVSATLTGQGCAARCVIAPIIANLDGDGCCPPNSDAVQDADCPPVCGNGVVEAPDELCDTAIPAGADGACPDTCALGGCEIRQRAGEGCAAHCELLSTITAIAPGDGCCPPGANAVTDDDCPATCGNGIVEPGETCDTALGGSCPESCDDDDLCTDDQRVGEGCLATCVFTPIPGCVPCGDGVVQPSERCDVAIAPGAPGACPTSCADDRACTADSLVGQGCQVRCEFPTISEPSDGDGCCPPGANAVTDSDCPAYCGNGIAEPPAERCDTALPVGQPGACPTACPADGCDLFVLGGEGCAAECTYVDTIEAFVTGDGCCPSGANALVDGDCEAVCGNGVVEPSEACDPLVAGSCPESCDDGDPCTVDSLIGAGCLTQCLHQLKQSPVDGDGCCLLGLPGEDSDCVACGDGEVGPTEACDVAIPAGAAGACPTHCDDGRVCTADALVGFGCQARCVAPDIVAFRSGDGCCPPGGNAVIDEDCAPLCGNGVAEPGEACDTAIPAGALGACPDSCAQQGCSVYAHQGEGCAAECTYLGEITAMTAGDGCCPAGANALLDPDCAAECGNGVVEPGERCDPALPGSCPEGCDDDDPCTLLSLQGQGCQARCEGPIISDPVDGDACCPAGASSLDDADCAVVCGNGLVEAGEACDSGLPAGAAGACPSGCDDGSACTIDERVGAGCQTRCVHEVDPSFQVSDEVCNQLDDDCDQLVDEGCASKPDGFPMAAGGTVRYGRVAYGDLDGDGARELIYADEQGRLHAKHLDGHELLAWPVQLSGTIYGKPAVGDVDGDGALEVAVGTDKGFVYVVNGDGSVAHGWPRWVAGQVRAAATLGDVDGDGDLEIIVGSYDDQVYVFRGDGSYLPGWPVAAGGEPRWATPSVGDIDGDGDLEVIICHSVGVSVFEPTGALRWQQAAGNIERGAAALGDIDGDGDLDVIVGSTNHKVYAFEGRDGLALYGWPRDVGHSVMSAPALADVDGDGDLDPILAARDGKLYALDDDGLDLAGWPVSVGDPYQNSPVVADVDGDGALEIVMSAWGGSIRALELDGALLAGWPVSAGNECGTPTLVDLDDDGELELYAPRSTQIVSWRFGADTATSSLMPWPTYGHDLGASGLWGGLAEPPSRCPADGAPCEGEPRGACEGDPRAEVCDGRDDDCDGLSDTSCSTSLPGWPKLSGGDMYHSKITWADLDGDGLKELISAGYDDKVHAWRPGGDELAGWPVSVLGDVRSKPAVGDVDDDGSLEVVVGSDSGYVYVFNEDGSIAHGWPHLTGGAARAGVVLEDLDGDGQLEIITGSYDDHVYVWRGDGRALAGWPAAVGGEPRYATPAVGDVDGDQYMELVVAHSQGLTLLDGDGSIEWQVAAGDIEFSSPALGDVDGDGQLEVAVGSEDGHIYLIEPSGAVANGWPRATGGAVDASPALADLDGDGDLEILVGSRDGLFYVLDHDGADHPGWPTWAADAYVHSPLVADLDGDGALDILVGSWSCQHFAYDRHGGTLPGWPIDVGDNCATPLLFDWQGDGRMDVVIPRDDDLYAYALGASSHDAARMPWPSYSHDLGNTGRYRDANETGAPCPAGATSCSDGPSAGCPDAPRAEVCDGIDNDCDGLVDPSCRTGLAGWPKAAGGRLYFSKLTYGDLSGDGVLELIYGGVDDRVHARRPDGGELQGWPVSLSGDVSSKPAVGDVDGDGALEVVVGSDGGKVYVINEDGLIANGWPRATGGAVRAGVVIADLDGDGTLEVIAGSYDDRVYAWHGDGRVVAGWPVAAGGEPRYATPAVADLDADGKLEVIVPHSNGVGVFEHDGTVKWQTNIGNVEFSSPAVGDIDHDGKLEIVVGSSNHDIYLLRANGSVPFGWPRVTGGVVAASPALADLDGDGTLEIVVGSRDGYLYGLDQSGADLTGWPILQEDFYVASPLIADLDGDDDLDIISVGWGCQAVAYEADGSVLPGWLFDLGDRCGTPLVFDWQGDGRADVVVPRDDDLYVYTLGEDTASAAHAPWPMYSGDLGNTGRYRGEVAPPEVCTGAATSCHDGVWGGCPGDPRAELCDGFDNDCDGLVDPSCRSTFPGWPKAAGGDMYYSKLTWGDLDGDGQPELIQGGQDDKLHAWRPNGTELSGWPVSVSGDVSAKPAVGDIDGDGALEVVVGADGGSIYAFNEDGTVVNGWPRLTGGAVRAGIVLADLDADTSLEIIAGSYDDKVWAFHGDGTLVAGWPVPAGGEPRYATPAVADLDGDLRPEVIVAHSAGLSVFEHDGAAKWQANIGAVDFSSPAVGDVDGDGQLEVVVGGNDGNIYLIKRTGVVPVGWPRDTGAAVNASPALADVDGDGTLEVFVGSRDGFLYGLDHTGADLVGWPILQQDFYVSSPVIADLDGDDVLEILAGGWGCSYTAYEADGRVLPGWPVDIGDNCATPLLFDWQGDGRMDVVLPRDDDLYVMSLGAGSYDATRMPWPMYSGDLANTGRYHGLAAPKEVCPDGEASCHAGPSVGCPNEQRAEVCDGFDNDCSGLTDPTCRIGYPGWPKPGGGALYFSGLRAADLDGDGAAELVYGGHDDRVHAKQIDGTELAGFPVALGADVRSHPAVADLDGDGAREVVVGADNGRVYAIGGNGVVRDGWPFTAGGAVRAGVVVADIDGVGGDEIIFGSYDDKLYVLDMNGAALPGWPVAAGGEPRYASPAVADIDGDGHPEVVVAHSTGLGVFEHDGTLKWQVSAGNIETSSPAVGDVAGDGAPEIVVGSNDKRVYVFNVNGFPAAGWPRATGGVVAASPTLANLDADEALEIVVGSRDGWLYAMNGDATDLPGWPIWVGDVYISSPVVRDLDGDGFLDVLAGNWTCRFAIYGRQGNVKPGWPMDIGDSCGTPTVLDWQGDGRAELAFPRNDTIYVYTLGEGSY